MTRHGRNNTASACYTYYERHRDAQDSGYGTLKARLGKDSVKDFDACCLTLQPCRIPVLTPQGFLYDKEFVLEYIMSKKAENLKKTKEYEKSRRKDQKELLELAQAETRSQAEAFAERQKSVQGHKQQDNNSDSISNMAQGRDKKLPSFWVPSETPASSKKTQLQKPDTNVYCPMSGKPLRVKDLFPVFFTPIDRVATGSSSLTKQDRWMCPVTHDVLSNSVPCTFLKTSGSVVTTECVEKIIRKDMMDPLNGKKLKDSDLISLQRGGTGYASTNQVEASIQKPSIQA